MENFAQFLNSLSQEIKKQYPIVDIVQEHLCLQENEDDVYQFINIVQVPESIISDVEDYAYGLLRIISPEKSLPIGFYLFTPEETAEKFPEFLRPVTTEFTARIACHSLLNEFKPSKWQAVLPRAIKDDDHATPTRFGFDLDKIMGGQMQAGLTYKNKIAANTELALAA